MFKITEAFTASSLPPLRFSDRFAAQKAMRGLVTLHGGATGFDLDDSSLTVSCEDGAVISAVREVAA